MKQLQSFFALTSRADGQGHPTDRLMVAGGWWLVMLQEFAVFAELINQRYNICFCYKLSPSTAIDLFCFHSLLTLCTSISDMWSWRRAMTQDICTYT